MFDYLIDKKVKIWMAGECQYNGTFIGYNLDGVFKWVKILTPEECYIQLSHIESIVVQE